MTLKGFFEGFDLIVARLRRPMRTLTALGAAYQAGIVAGLIKVPPGTRWSNALALFSITVAFYTMRGGNESVALARAQEMDETPAPPVANVGGPVFPPVDPPAFPPRKPTRESEALTPPETPRSKTRP